VPWWYGQALPCDRRPGAAAAAVAVVLTAGVVLAILVIVRDRRTRL
jgi:hypothetical protein